MMLVSSTALNLVMSLSSIGVSPKRLTPAFCLSALRTSFLMFHMDGTAHIEQ